MPVLSLRREEKALLLPAGGHHDHSVAGEPFKLRNGSTGSRNKYRNQADTTGKMFWSPPSSSSTNIPPTPPPRRLLSSPLSRPLSPSLSRTLSPPPPPRGPPSPMPAASPPSSPHLTVEETQFLTPRRPKQSKVVGYPKRKFRRRGGEANGGSQETAYMQLTSNGVERRPTDRCALVFLSFLFHGLAAALPLAALLVSQTFRVGLVGGCSPWMSSPANLLIVLISFHLIGALPASLLPVRYIHFINQGSLSDGKPLK